MKIQAAIVILALALATPATAQSGPTGIGFAQAEEGTWWCRGNDPDKALACALDQCTRDSGGQDCYATRWCLPAGWSGLMIAWLPEFHSTIVLCGTSGEAALIAALKSLCDGSPSMTRCVPFTIIDPDGNEKPIEGIDWPGPAIKDTGTPADIEPAEGSEPPG